jgi:hypothetical protein
VIPSKDVVSVYVQVPVLGNVTIIIIKTIKISNDCWKLNLLGTCGKDSRCIFCGNFTNYESCYWFWRYCINFTHGFCVLVLHNPLFVGDYIHLYSLHKNLGFMTTCMIAFVVICAISDYMWLHDYVVELNLSL